MEMTLCKGVKRLPGLPPRTDYCQRRRTCLRWLLREDEPAVQYLCDTKDAYLPNDKP
jgi:hypothetical protein